MLTSVNGCLKGYFYDDAYIRTSCIEFDIEDVQNKYIHLTNDAVQKWSEDYGRFENGNKLSMGDFQRYLRNYFNKDSIDIKKLILPQIKKLITDTFRATYDKVDSHRLKNSFEVFVLFHFLAVWV